MSPLVEKVVSHKRHPWIVAIVALVLLAAGAVFFAAGDHLRSSVVGTIDDSTYQAVHLDTGETYFGKVTQANDDFVTLSDVFYFLDESKKTLVKRGQNAEADDSLSVNRAHVLATENLSPDGAVLKAILKYKANKN
ncbi:MAG: hypothetical protein V1936_02465 [Patescibacteria group bacterium]